jgi:hypothetical protein
MSMKEESFMRVTFSDVDWRRDIGEAKAGLDWER